MNLTDEDIKKVIDEGNILTNMHKIRENGAFLSDEEISILESYGIFYNEFQSLIELIHQIDFVNEEVGSDVLEQIAVMLAEQQYYQNTNK